MEGVKDPLLLLSLLFLGGGAEPEHLLGGKWPDGRAPNRIANFKRACNFQRTVGDLLCT